MRNEWKNVRLTEGQATFIETIKNAIMNDYQIKLTTNDVLVRLVYLGLGTLNKEVLMQDPMLLFQETGNE